MKIILLLTLLISSPAWSCGDKTQAQVSSCTVQDKFRELFMDIYPNHSQVRNIAYLETEDKTNLYSFEDFQTDEDGNNIPESLFSRLMMLDKPDISVFTSRLDQWKEQRITRLNFIDSVKGIDRLRRRARLCSLEQPNLAILKKEIILNSDSAKRDCLLSHTATLDAEDLALSQKETQIQNAKDRMKARDCSTLSGFQRDICILLKR